MAGHASVGDGVGLAVGAFVHAQPTHFPSPICASMAAHVYPWLAIHASQFFPSCTGGHAAVGCAVGTAHAQPAQL